MKLQRLVQPSINRPRCSLLSRRVTLSWTDRKHFIPYSKERNSPLQKPENRVKLMLIGLKANIEDKISEKKELLLVQIYSRIVRSASLPKK